MTEVYLFHATFAVQILVISVLIPRRLLQRMQQELTRNPPDPGGEEAVQRMRYRYRIANIVITCLGLILMAMLYRYMQRSDWRAGPVGGFLTLYFLLQFLPFGVLAFRAAHVNKLLRASLSAERRMAVLHRRRLFDFVSPLVVGLTLLGYVLFVALVLFIQHDPFEGFAGDKINIGIMTALYCVMALGVYRILYGRKNSPLQTHAEHMQQIGMGVRAMVYSCLGAIVVATTNFALVLLDKQRLESTAESIYFIVIALWLYKGMNAPIVAMPLEAPHNSVAH